VDIGEVARLAGVSRSTVSYALSGKRRISADTRARVNAVIQEVGFRPSAPARALAAGRTQTLALLMPRPGQRFRLASTQMPFVVAVVHAAEQRGFDVLLSPVGGGVGREHLTRLVTERRVDGVLVMETSLPDPTARLLHSLRATFATIGRTGSAVEHDWVDIDHAGAIEACTRHLLDLGHRRVALVTVPREMSAAGYGPALQARDGFQRAVGEAGAAGTVHDCECSAAAGQALTRTLLDLAEPTTGFVSNNHEATAGIYAAVRAAGLSVPDDVSITGTVVPESMADGVLVPPLTGVEVPVEALAGGAVAALVDRLAAPDAPWVQTLVTPPLIIRASTARPRARAAMAGSAS